MTDLQSIRATMAGFRGPDLARSTGETIAQSGKLRLTLKIPGDDGAQPEPDEPAGPYVGAIVRLLWNDRVLATDSLWGIFEDFEAGGSWQHPWWDHMAGIVRDLAETVTDPDGLRLQIGGDIATLQAIQQEVLA
jgi:hypothetical protein